MAVGNPQCVALMPELPDEARFRRLGPALSTHTRFPEGTNVRVTREGTLLKGPGIGDDCRGLAVVIGVIRALNHAKVQTPGTITFVDTVGEEGLSDLRGVKHLLAGGSRTASTGSSRWTARASGSRMSASAVTLPRDLQGAWGPATARLASSTRCTPWGPWRDQRLPGRRTKVTFNVGRIGGGTSINSIPFEAWMEVDMRSADAAALKAIEASFLKALDDAVVEENDRWGHNGTVVVVKDLVGTRPAGRPPILAHRPGCGVGDQALGLPVRSTMGPPTRTRR
jgi:acetylornithine deacetylase/succinyl-diaminopimelate desuccinylase-like protein